MKGVIKKCGLLLVLPIMLGLSCVISSDVSALKYSIDILPFWEPIRNTSNPNFLTDPEGLQITSSSDFNPELVDSLNVSSWESGSSSGSSFTGSCDFVAFDSIPRVLDSGDNVTLKYGFNGFDFSSYSGSSTVDPCLTLSSMSDYNIPVALDQAVRDNLPFRFPFSGAYRSSSGRLVDDGPILSSKFDFISLFGPGADNSDNVPSVIKSLNIPFGYPSSYQTLSPGTPIEFSGEFVIDPEDFTDFSIDSSIQLEQRVFNGSGDIGSPALTSCSSSLGRDDPNDPYSVYYLRYSCSTIVSSYFDPSSTVPWFTLKVDFSYSGSSTKLSMLIFDSSISITNNDPTDGGSWFDSMFGSNPSQAFGSINRSEVISTPDYDSSLTDMFSFGFINPFEPILHLFTDNSSCVQIPTIAGMIHSEETQVCPWFDSNVRNIVTPVLGLSSMMLIFGFAVRWLGARSGNMFEDSFEGSSGGISIGTKGRSK